MTETAKPAATRDVRPSFGSTWRFSLAIFWKFIAAVFLFAAVLQFASYALPFGQVEYWGAGVAYRMSEALEIAWLTPEALKLVWSVAVTAAALAAQFVVFNLLVAAHVGRRFNSVEVVLREAR